MKFAKVDNKRIEATKGATGICPVCGSEVIARCGEKNIHHWSHKTKCSDHWWENETEWHRNWKNQFPKEWQEIVHFDDSGEKHIADIKTPENWVVEFQHSAIKPEERRSRNEFYNKDSNLIWVVDGTRRKTDLKQFKDELEFGNEINKNPLLIEALSESRLLEEWGYSESFVFLDFGDNEIGKEYLWCICPVQNGKNFITKVTKKPFIELLNNKKFGISVMHKIIEPLEEAEIQQQIQHKEWNIRLLQKDIALLRQSLDDNKTYKENVSEGSIINQRVGYVIGICKNKYKSFDREDASTMLNGYKKALSNANHSNEEIVIEFNNNVIPKTKQTRYWLEWKKFMQALIESV
jgi:competence protein CoiA